MKHTLLLIMLFLGVLSGCNTIKQSRAEEIQTHLDKAVGYYERENYDLTELELIRALQLSEKEYGTQSNEVANIHLEAALYSTAYEKSIEHIQLAEGIYKNSDNMGGLANTYEMYGRSYDAKQNPELARQAYEEALKYCDMSIEDTSDTKFHLYLLLSVLNNTSDEESLQYSMEAEKLLDRLPESEKNEDTIKLYRNMGNNYFNLMKREEAIESYEKVIDCWTQYGSKDQISIAECFDFCGYSYAMIGKFDRAVKYIHQSIELLEDSENAKLWHFSIAYRHLSLIYTLEEIQDYDKSLQYGIKSCKIYTEQQELSTQELEELKTIKTAFKELYDKSPMAEQQEFESWYQENINKQPLIE